MDYQTKLSFNPAPATIMHLDINSCFATIEQQANPLLRGKPVVVAAYPTASGCILASSVEAKKLGVKTGMRVREAWALCPSLVVLDSDPDKYRQVHLELKKLLGNYTDRLVPKSIDEFILSLEGYPSFGQGYVGLAKEIKGRIKEEVGDWITVSIGFGPNRFLAKTASNLKKPDGLELIDKENFHEVYERLSLTDLYGIDKRNAFRLNSVGIFTVPEFVGARWPQLKAAFQSIGGYYWYLRLRGWEIDSAPIIRKSFGNSYTLPKPLTTEPELTPTLLKLTAKMAARLRRGGYRARGVQLVIGYKDGTSWGQAHTTKQELFASLDFYRYIRRLLEICPYRKPVRQLAVSCFDLVLAGPTQLLLFENLTKTSRLVRAVDRLNRIWGEYTIMPARVGLAANAVKDRIGFGNVRELNER